MASIDYSIPNVGPVNIPLYEPADQVYQLLLQAGEIERLAKLKHIGSLEFAYPGIAHTRWDYTVSMLYVVTRLRRLVANSNFSIGGREYSSVAAALQCLALLTNIGHFPGTFGVEKGVVRFLLTNSRKSPADAIFKSELGQNLGDYRKIVNRINDKIAGDDYAFVKNFTAILKLTSNFRGAVAIPDWLSKDLFIPFALPELRAADPRWLDIDEYFDVARRLAYLNRDTALVSSPVTVALSPLLSDHVDPSSFTKEELRQCKEITSAYEHTVYERFYHAPKARKTTALVASAVYGRLKTEDDPVTTISNWMYEHDIESVVDAALVRERLASASLVGTLSMRSFFCSFGASESEIESEVEGFLATSGGARAAPAVAVCKYVPPASIHAFEPDQVYLDAFVSGPVKAQYIGLLMKWVGDDLDSLHAHPSDDFFNMLVKLDASRAYEELLRQLVYVALEGVELDLVGWPLSRLGKFPTRDDGRGDIPLWHVSADLGDQLTKHIVRDNSKVPPSLKSIRNELRGLSQLRARLRQGWNANTTRPRKRHILMTSSIRLTRTVEGNKTTREFDGGILQISARTGTAKLYLLETKSSKSPTKSANLLDQKIAALGLKGETTRLRKRSAFVEITL